MFRHNEMISDIDDIIRGERKKLGYPKSPLKSPLTFLWGKNYYNKLKELYEANAPCIHGWACFCGKIAKKWKWGNRERPLVFMGCYHRRDFNKMGDEWSLLRK